MSAGCPFITCAIKKKGIEFCWQCKENETCEKWRKHREFSKRVDSFEGRSKSYYCVTATVLEIEELEEALTKAKKDSTGLEIKVRSKVLHSILDEIAERKNYYLKLRK
jgi:TPP-dependent trihydroxycyclohexane-1,2-dione (THcHDO) dehydratase